MYNGAKVFLQEGIYGKKDIIYKTDENVIKRWREGNTGMPLIDSFMREMNLTGLMTGRGRMIVAQYFCLDLR